MKVALVHDYIKEYGGAERVLEALHELYPDAPVYTSVYLPEFLGPHRKRFENWDIRTSWLQHIPFKEKLISPLRLLAPFAFQEFDFRDVDVVIVSATGAYASNMIDKKKAMHLCYCHTPPRYLYGFATARNWKKHALMRIAGESANWLLRLADKAGARRVDHFIANSNNVASRIKRFYNRDSAVIYPPVDIPEIRDKKKEIRRDYYLAGGRLARPKHIDLIVKTAVKNKLPLKVFGRPFGGSEQEILGYYDTKISRDGTKKSPSISISQYPNIEFLGEVGDEEKFELMKHAKAFLFAAEDEDFGITPVEAMACGTPVIAYRSGGVVESVIEGKTGFFFDALTEESLFTAIKKLDTLKIDPKECIEQGMKFNKERFKTQIQLFVSSLSS